MTRTEFEEMELYDLINWADENIYEFTDEEMLISFAKKKIDEDNIGMAIHPHRRYDAVAVSVVVVAVLSSLRCVVIHGASAREHDAEVARLVARGDAGVSQAPAE